MDEITKLYFDFKNNLSIDIYAEFLYKLTAEDVDVIGTLKGDTISLQKMTLKEKDKFYYAIFTSEKIRNQFAEKKPVKCIKINFLKLIQIAATQDINGIIINPSVVDKSFHELAKEDIINISLINYVSKFKDMQGALQKFLFQTFISSKTNVTYCSLDVYDKYIVGSEIKENRNISCVVDGVKNEEYTRVIIISNRYLQEEDSPLEYLDGENIFKVIHKEIVDGKNYVILLHLPSEMPDKFENSLNEYVKYRYSFDELIFKYDMTSKLEEVEDSVMDIFFQFDIGFEKNK